MKKRARRVEAAPRRERSKKLITLDIIECRESDAEAGTNIFLANYGLELAIP